MRFWFDTEFLDTGKSIGLISIGIVAEDGREYYAETVNARQLCSRSEWLIGNVLPHLTGPTKFRGQMVTEIVQFVGHKPEFWSYCAAYDWVSLCQLFGPMINTPGDWPHYSHDLQQVMDQMGGPKIPPPVQPQHNALMDARWHKQIWEYLTNLRT